MAVLTASHRSRWPHHAPSAARRLGLVSVLGLAFAVLPFPQPAAGAAALRCATAPAAASIIADVPWPQHRFDLAALSQITDGSGVTVAVVDSGVDARHPQLAGAVRSGADMIDAGGDGRRDCVGHGTAVASIIAARPRAGFGLRGLAPGVQIFPIRASERVAANGTVTGAGDVSDLADGIRAAIRSRPVPAVINLSISTGTDDPRLRDAVRDALAADIVVVAAAGNQHEQGDPTPYPAAYPGVIGVGGIGRDGMRVASSSVGSYVDLVAPGAAVVGAAPAAGHYLLEGTSFATPFVAATAALIRARWPKLHQDEVTRRLLATADPVPGARPSRQYGYGAVNPLRALTEIVPADGGVVVPPALPPLESSATSVPTRPAPAVVAVTVALALAAGGVAALAAALPAARRRRWRPDPPAAVRRTEAVGQPEAALRP